MSPRATFAATSTIESPGAGGRWMAAAPAFRLRSAAPRWLPVPAPVEPKVSSAGRDVATATRSCKVLMPESRPVTNT